MTDPDKTRPISPAFGSSVSFVIDVLEGGAKLVKDSGGLTKWGISKRSHPDVDIENLAREDAIRIYRDKYWDALYCDSLPRGLDLLVFDAAVNMGHDRAVRLLQRVLEIREDGIIGPQTIAAAKAYHPQQYLRALYKEIRRRTYIDLVRNKPAYMKYEYGWAMRMELLGDEAGRVGGAA